MTERVYKYNLITITDEQVLPICGLKQVLCVKKQRGFPVLYAIVDVDDTEMHSLLVMTRGTGNNIMETGYTYLGTLLFDDDDLVFHYFYREI